ncbi:MAG: hypothetical protein JW810_13375, partial [Sedimentisphaerales bacterium]|nr:hypothetical protein [Sedimentisphaerales bacterium]
MDKRLGTILLCMVLWYGWGVVPDAVRAETPDISALTWTLDGSINASLKKVGKGSSRGEMTLYIGPN